MANLRIMLCGASDLEDLPQLFSSVVKEMGCQPVNYFDPISYDYDEYGSPETNSANAVLNSDILVYVINKRIGEITWNTEFATAWTNRKPFLILCHEKTFVLYTRLKLEAIENLDNTDTKESVRILKMLESAGAVPIPFDNNTFGHILRNEIVKKLYAGIKVLAANNKKEAFVNLLKKGSYKDLKEKLIVETEKSQLLNILNDPFESKEVRKRVITFFTHNKGLNDEQIISLIKDGEQGVSRKTVDELSKLITDQNNIEHIFEGILEAIDEHDDVGLIRRGIKSMLEISPLIAAQYLKKLFPATDIGTPKRILSWLNENYSFLAPYLEDQNVKSEIRSLADEASTFDKELTLKKMYEAFIKKLES